MTESKAKIRGKTGMHARPAAIFVEAANRFRSEILVSSGEEEVNGKSIMGILMLAATSGTVLTIKAEGEDEAEAAKALANLIENGFKKK